MSTKDCVMTALWCRTPV